MITKGSFISLSLGAQQQRHKLPPADYTLISVNALFVILINIPAFMILSPLCNLIKQSVLQSAAFSLVAWWFPCLNLKYLQHNLSFSLDSANQTPEETAVAAHIITDNYK